MLEVKDNDLRSITLNTGARMPLLGLGVLGRENREETADAVETALNSGYRLIDTAASYLNEADVGEGLRRSGVDRSDVFLTTKLWLTKYGYDEALRAFDASLRRLRVEYVDLYLLHWPVPSAFDLTIQSYRAAEKLFAEGRARAIGVSNFGISHLEDLMAASEIVPAVNQVELHPGFTQRQLRKFHAKTGIATEAWSPLGGSVRRSSDAQTQDPLLNPVISDTAGRYGKTSAQIILRWHIENRTIAIPKSFNPSRIAKNFDIFDFSLTNEEIAAIDLIDPSGRCGPDPQQVRADTFPITVED